MSDQFPLKPGAFSGGSRLTSAQRSEGPDGAPLTELLNELAAGASSSTALAASLDLSAATAEVVAAASGGVSTNTGAARTLTLPDFGTAPDGWKHTALALDASGFDVAPAGADTINTVAATKSLAAAGVWLTAMKIAGETGWVALGGTTP